MTKGPTDIYCVDYDGEINMANTHIRVVCFNHQHHPYEFWQYTTHRITGDVEDFSIYEVLEKAAETLQREYPGITKEDAIVYVVRVQHGVNEEEIIQSVRDAMQNQKVLRAMHSNWDDADLVHPIPIQTEYVKISHGDHWVPQVACF